MAQEPRRQREMISPPPVILSVALPFAIVWGPAGVARGKTEPSVHGLPNEGLEQVRNSEKLISLHNVEKKA